MMSTQLKKGDLPSPRGQGKPEACSSLLGEEIHEGDFHWTVPLELNDDIGILKTSKIV